MPSTTTLYRAFLLPGNDLGNAATETQFPNGRGTRLILQLPSNNSLANKRFRLVIAGRVQTPVLGSFTINVYFGFSNTISANTQMFSSGPQSLFNTTSNFSFWIDLYWDSVSQKINGIGEGQMDNNPIGRSTLTNQITGVDPNRDSSTFLNSGPTYGFTLTGQFGNSNAGNHAFVDDFSLELS